ncbi:MAG: hypothetical protein V2I36_00650 [Desulfopila sp.]|nr:hypothetical protein [Desulfopila sp.]
MKITDRRDPNGGFAPVSFCRPSFRIIGISLVWNGIDPSHYVRQSVLMCYPACAILVQKGHWGVGSCSSSFALSCVSCFAKEGIVSERALVSGITL